MSLSPQLLIVGGVVAALALLKDKAGGDGGTGGGGGDIPDLGFFDTSGRTGDPLTPQNVLVQDPVVISPAGGSLSTFYGRGETTAPKSISSTWAGIVNNMTSGRRARENAALVKLGFSDARIPVKINSTLLGTQMGFTGIISGSGSTKKSSPLSKPTGTGGTGTVTRLSSSKRSGNSDQGSTKRSRTGSVRRPSRW